MLFAEFAFDVVRRQMRVRGKKQSVNIRESDAAESEGAIIEALRSENAMLRARIAELEQKHEIAPLTPGAEPPRDDIDLQQSHALLQAVLDNSTAVIFVKDAEGRYTTVNRRHEELFHIPRAKLLGTTDHDHLPAQMADQIRKNDRAIIETGVSTQIEEHVPVDDGIRTYVSVKFPIFDSAGKVSAMAGISTDITALRRAEEERSALQAQIIEAHRTALRELSTPLIPLAEGVLVMPIIGTLDSSRAAQLMDTLLQGVTAHGARMVILDITGVKVVDTQVANALIQAAQAARLLGAEVVLTGIGPHVATTLIGLGVDLANLTTLGTLRAGVDYALRRRR
jgi:rsbT co-antagonist protein RsbR